MCCEVTLSSLRLTRVFLCLETHECGADDATLLNELVLGDSRKVYVRKLQIVDDVINAGIRHLHEPFSSASI